MSPLLSKEVQQVISSENVTTTVTSFLVFNYSITIIPVSEEEEEGAQSKFASSERGRINSSSVFK